jgi:hypothetical protein
LPVRHRPVLTGGERGDQMIRVTWCTHTVHEATRTGCSPPKRRRSDYPTPVPSRANARRTAATAGFGRPW